MLVIEPADGDDPPLDRWTADEIDPPQPPRLELAGDRRRGQERHAQPGQDHLLRRVDVVELEDAAWEVAGRPEQRVSVCEHRQNPIRRDVGAADSHEPR